MRVCFAVFCVWMGVGVLAVGRDPLKQPFSSDSIWNTPIGDGAVYVHARLEGGDESGVTVDEDLIVLRPDAPMTPIRMSTAGWNREKDRCVADGGKVLFSAPIPDEFVVGPQNWDGEIPNSGLAVLMPDGCTIRQTQPFARCRAGGVATSRYDYFAPEDLYGPGISGAHGGSGLSVLGGTLRVGELRPDSGPISHVLKINVYAARNLFYDEETLGYRWPASTADGYAAEQYGTQRVADPVPACRMGALVALPASLAIEDLGLETEPARVLARAFQDYGAYIADDTYWDVFAIEAEWGPDGRFIEQFESDWGFPFTTEEIDTPWSRDIRRIFHALHVVDNNGPATVGGGGTPRRALAPPLN